MKLRPLNNYVAVCLGFGEGGATLDRPRLWRAWRSSVLSEAHHGDGEAVVNQRHHGDGEQSRYRDHQGASVSASQLRDVRCEMSRAGLRTPW